MQCGYPHLFLCCRMHYIIHLKGGEGHWSLATVKFHLTWIKTEGTCAYWSLMATKGDEQVHVSHLTNHSYQTGPERSQTTTPKVSYFLFASGTQTLPFLSWMDRFLWYNCTVMTRCKARKMLVSRVIRKQTVLAANSSINDKQGDRNADWGDEQRAK